MFQHQRELDEPTLLIGHKIEGTSAFGKQFKFSAFSGAGGPLCANWVRAKGRKKLSDTYFDDLCSECAR